MWMREDECTTSATSGVPSSSSDDFISPDDSEEPDEMEEDGEAAFATGGRIGSRGPPAPPVPLGLGGGEPSKEGRRASGGPLGPPQRAGSSIFHKRRFG